MTEIDRTEGVKMASNNTGGILRIVGMLLTPILRAMTPKIEEELEKFLLKFYVKAEATDNPLDDLLAGFLLRIFDIDIPEGE